MERGTEYGLEQAYNVIDSRYRSNKPLIVTTNLALHELQPSPPGLRDRGTHGKLHKENGRFGGA